jgi:hypothetical protein
MALADLHIESDGTFVAFSRLELHGVAFVEIFELGARREAAAVKKDILGAVVGDDKAEAFLLDNLSDRTGHRLALLSYATLDLALLDIPPPLPKDDSLIHPIVA